jgi:putative DNA primase/helicase
MRSQLYEFLENALTLAKNGTYTPFNPTKDKVNQILDALKANIYTQAEEREAPFWPGPHQDRDGRGLIACRNGLLDIETLKLEPHSPHFFNVTCLSFDYDAEAPIYPKQWLQFLKQLWPDDKAARHTLQEIFGLLLTPDTTFQKLFLAVRPRRSGKGTIARVLTALLGDVNVTGPTLASLNRNFGLTPLIDKRCAIVADARLGERGDVSTVAERLLSISGEDTMTIDRKYREAWTGQLCVRFVILTNELPRIADASQALASRFVILMLKQSFLGREDRTLTTKLKAELPGILNWALRGLHRLRARGHFEMPKSSLDAIRTLEDLASPVGAFVREWCYTQRQQDEGREGFRAETPEYNVKSLFDAYSQWCWVEGHRPNTSALFGRNLKALLPQIETAGRGAGRRYVGIRLSKLGFKEYQRALKEHRNA